MEEAASPACMLDGHGRIIVANRALEMLLGVGAAGGLTGRSLPSLAYPPDEELAEAAVQQVLAEGLDRCQVDARWVRIHSRELVWGAWDLSLVRDRRGRPELAIAMVRDLTEMKCSDHERRFFEFMFKLIGEADSSHQVLTAAVQTICHFERLEGPSSSAGTGYGAGHLPQDRRGPRGWHRHRGRPRDRHPDRAAGGGRRPLAVPRADRRGPPVRSLRVLLVEDDPDHEFLVRRALADLPGAAVTVEVAGDGEQALERLARSRFEAGGPPQLVLLDLKMPRMAAWSCSAASAPTRPPAASRWWC